MGKLLETQDLRANFYTYEGVVKALNGVSIVVDHGSTFGLVGESGCGKSVTVRSIMRIIQEPGKIESGKVIVYFNDADCESGIDLLQETETRMEELRGNQISMIFQEPNSALNPILSINEQISESFLIHQSDEMRETVLAELQDQVNADASALKRFQLAIFKRQAANKDDLLVKILRKIPLLKRWEQPLFSEATRRSTDIISKLGIANAEQVVTRYPHEISGGMKQRIVIAIALACNPTLLIADEPTSNLDVTIQAQIIELIKELKEKYISSVLFITHDLGVVAETCDRVGVMYAGNLCEVADVQELFNNPKHPYTAALLHAVPKISQEGALASIEGTVPNLVHPPSGCRFHPRCPKAMPICKTEFPASTEVADNHFVSCYLHQ
ncbi:dipeptide/oligopeptide/nickel ABC transporter ATP-binding protein [candidate division KSB3 bacterium]|uniref:Nickel import system ATP-binding protein NikD n=1 Tax=candidate division KSB3 bacterium TaxID=2044937 RepID=A0A2G6E931_9BACT|nr:MAG: dipeptide/oligopeptide/nickel ABC transporter ATP-binding protein [candidate division KSB3 bacterium]PIE30576.1 MAG: dipeptide/oligopeptide/nickel ABC transporter ATP-binding protein [candidate division KSB3 bacterium]